MNSLKINPISLFFYIIFFFFISGSALAQDPESKSTDAVTAILFEHEADQFATYKISDKGHVDIVFARNTPDLIYAVILNKLLHHPDIPVVLAGKGGPTCTLFR